MSELAPRIENTSADLQLFDKTLETLRPYLEPDDIINLQFTPATEISYKGKAGILRFFVFEPSSESTPYSSSLFAEITHPGDKRDIIRVQRERLNPQSRYYRGELAEVQKNQRKLYTLKNLAEFFDTHLEQSKQIA